MLRYIMFESSTRRFGPSYFGPFGGAVIMSVLRAAPNLERMEFDGVYRCDLDGFDFVLEALGIVTIRDSVINQVDFAKLLSLTPNLEHLFFQSALSEVVHKLTQGDLNYQITPAQARDVLIMHCSKITSVELWLAYASFEGQGNKKEIAELTRWFALSSARPKATRRQSSLSTYLTPISARNAPLGKYVSSSRLWMLPAI
ncbi:hypothetical protein QBC42DRAFT_263096 [Cladorrhinum samala]|uniref:Uncharacterized protein n=1 Tax=Cladorrhinum samala TaxID=585594 RepID=A0AAV9HVJ8_9PEZI|nr:hypothetical protein QBC42DRAFT_263096 [Cladorrhinum samala]